MTLLDRERWRQLEPLLDHALELSVEQRADWLDALRTTSPEIAADLSSLLDDDVAAERRGFLAAPVELSLAGVVVGAYTLERPLGHGGMGSVWLARRTDGRFEGTAAVKLLNLSLSTEAGRARFRREGSLLARLTHAGIARLLDAGVSPSGQPYLVLEHVDGERIDRYVTAHGLGIADRVRLFLQVLDAVGHAHANLVVHRDIKPSNILVTPAGVAKLLDFGIATLLDGEANAVAMVITADGMRAFTPEFAAPEQIDGHAITTATDVYSLGVLLYLLVAGRHPTAEGCATPGEAIKSLLERPPAPIAVGDLEMVLRKALAKAPRERYQTVGAFAADLRRWLNDEPVTARANSVAHRTHLLLRRHRVAALAAAAGAMLLVVYVTTVLMDRERVRRALADATDNAHRAEQVTDFAVGMFDANGMGRGTMDSLTVRNVLARGIERAHELEGQPATEAQMLDLIGRIRTQIGDYAAARSPLEEALRIRRRTLGDDHPDVATSLINLADLTGVAADQERDAVPLLQRAFDIRHRQLGDGDPRTADALYRLASALHAAGQYDRARPMFEQWRQIVAKQPVQLTPERAAQLGTIAIMMQFSHQLPRADTLFRQRLALDRELYGDRHYQVAVDLSQLGGVRLDLGDTTGADTLLHQAVALLRANYPAGHPELANSLRDLGDLLVTTRRWAEAEAVWRESAANYRRYSGPDGMGYANAMTYLGRVLTARGEYEEAEKTLRAVLATAPRRNLHPDPLADRGRVFLGDLLREEGRFTEAEPLLRQAVEAKSPLAARGRPFAAQSLVKLYDAEGRTAEANRYRAMLADMMRSAPH
jgi:eukaryotic-like serine/threonine-protein kinase